MSTIHISKIDGDVPDDATHYIKGSEFENEGFFKKNIVRNYFRRVGDKTWTPCSEAGLITANPQIIIRDPLPETLETPYVPKVGDHMECSWGVHAFWNECVVIPDGLVAVKLQEGWKVQGNFHTSLMEFRPIQSEEDKQREEILEAWTRFGGLKSAHDAIESFLTVREMIDFIMTLQESES